MFHFFLSVLKRLIFYGLLFNVCLIGAVVLWLWYYCTIPAGNVESALAAEAVEEGEGTETSQDLMFADPPLSGTLTIRRQLAPSPPGSGGTFPSWSNLNEPTIIDSDPAYEDSEGNRDRSDDSSLHTIASTTTASDVTTSTYASRLSRTYRTMVEARNTRFSSVPKDTYHCVLRGTVLFIYENESHENCLAALGLPNYVVSIEKPDGPFDGKDAQMFTKRSAIVLKPKKGNRAMLPALTKAMQADQGEEQDLERRAFYISVKPNTLMEDWYLALVQASGQATTSDSIFDIKDMKSLVGTIDTEPDPIPMRWFNAMIGRIFFALYQTESLEQFIKERIIKKTSKLELPAFLSPIEVKEVNVGTTAPYFSKPMLKELRPDGTTSFEAHVLYRAKSSKPDSQLRITIETQVVRPIRFRAVLAVVVKSLEGNVLIHMKKPPSNRIWWGFTTMPEIDVEIKPVISGRSLQSLAPVIAFMEKHMRDQIRDSIVLPNMDDLAIFDTSHLTVRGGIFDEARKFKRNTEGDKEEPSTLASEPSQELGTANEDPSSAVPTTTALRHRHKNRAQSTDLTNIELRPSGHVEATGLGIPRTDTAPPAIGSNTTTKASTAVRATKRWFAQAGTSRPPSLSTQTVTGGLPITSDPEMMRQRSGSSERRGVPDAQAHSVDANFENEPVVAPVRVSSSTKGLLDSEKSSLAPTPTNESGPSSTSTGGIHPHTLSAPTPPSEHQASNGRTSVESERAIAVAPGPGTQSSTTALMNNFRARDKKALQAQANAAKDSLKKWGVGFVAKRRGDREATLVQEEHRPSALYRPPEEDTREDDAPIIATSPSSGRSLQDRLNAAAHAGAAPLNIPARERSASSSSRPSLFASPGKSTASPASSSPPNWAPAMSKPTTSVVKDEATTHPPASIPVPTSGSASVRRGSNSTPVSMQPAPGRSMVVPRVPKRPGQVTGIGHNANEPMVRRVSTDDGFKEERIENVGLPGKVPPALPPRRSKEALRSESQSVEPVRASLDIPSPARSGSNTPEAAVPPPLLSRNKLSPTPSISGLTAGKHATPTQLVPEPIQRSNSASESPVGTPVTSDTGFQPGHGAASPNPEPLAEDRIANGQEEHQRDFAQPLTPSVAEHALRKVVAKNDGVTSAKPRLSDGSDVGSIHGTGKVNGANTTGHVGDHDGTNKVVVAADA
ncbi:hypothetical protein I317_06023 [Kwoniella heveanensis CBS 569]|nr:hypothetical protein I317_06023 [Kwoniella heveanensis CBS 569]